MKYFITLIFLMLGISSQAQTYKLYQTDNIHNQLRLNTKTGEVYQIQDDGQKFVINYAVTPDNESANRYMLYKTRNIWTFILLDRWTGKLWQCQFRWVLSIPFFISCIRQQNPLTVLSKIILRKVKQFNLPPPKKK